MLSGVHDPVANLNGFLLSLRVTGVTTWETLALNELDPVAQATSFKPFWRVFPSDAGFVFQPYGSYKDQFRVPPGSILWAYQYASLNSLVSLQLTNTTTDEILFSDFVQGAGQDYTANYYTGLTLLPAPIVITEPGTMAMELSSLDSTTLTGQTQVILYFQVPSEYCAGPDSYRRWNEGILV